MMTERDHSSWLFITLAAAAMLMITMGARQAQGLFVFPISGSTGVSIVTISFAMAVGQFLWGAVAPAAGALADRFGPARVLTVGIIVLAV
ncbi:MAG TPA: MFS transporter, partial [Candidatus Binatia bacterium]|nr:MFS transporter [Candidatus Binatia bacterium]